LKAASTLIPSSVDNLIVAFELQTFSGDLFLLQRRGRPTGLEEAYGVCKLFPLCSLTDAHVALRLIRDSTDLALCLRPLDCLIESW
jgi:hypothetical protein